MLYKVTPMLTPAEKPKKQQHEVQEGEAPKEPRKRRKSSVFDADGHEVLITMMCLKCRSMKPLTMFGLRKMADGAIRNQPWCRTCRSGASTRKKKDAVVEAPAEQTLSVSAPPALLLASPPAPAASAEEHEPVAAPMAADAAAEPAPA